MKWLSLFFLFFCACSADKEQPGNKASDSEESESLHIHFQKGFYQDTVLLYHGDQKIYERVLSSKPEEQPTDVFSIPLQQIRDTIYFELKQEGQNLKGFVPPKASPYVGFYITAGMVVNIYSSETPFIYTP